MRVGKIIGIVLIVVALTIPFTGGQWTQSLILGAFGIGLFFFGP